MDLQTIKMSFNSVAFHLFNSSSPLGCRANSEGINPVMFFNLPEIWLIWNGTNLNGLGTFSLPLNKLMYIVQWKLHYAVYARINQRGLPIWWSWYSWFINDWFVRKLKLISSNVTLPSHLPRTRHLSQQ